MISNDNSKWKDYGKHTDMDAMLQSSLSDLNLTKPPPSLPRYQTPVPAHQPANTSNGPTAVPPGAQYRFSQPQQGFYQQPLEWIQGKGSIPPLYQQVASLCADPRQSYYMLTDRVQPMLISSGLDQDKLKAIWNVSSRTAPGVLTLTEFYTALGLVALAQQGHDISMDKLAGLSFIPIPRIDTTRITLYQAPTPPPVISAPPVAAARTAPIEPHGFGAFHSGNSSTSFVTPQDAVSEQEFGNFQSASPTSQVPLSLHGNDNNTEEFGQLNSASPIQPRNTELTSAVSDPSDKYSCFRNIDNVHSQSADMSIRNTEQAADSRSDDKYAFLRALDVANEPKETLPPLSHNSTLLQPTHTTNDQEFSAFKSAEPATTVNTLDISLFDGSISQSNQAPVPCTSSSVAPDRTPEFNDLSDFSVFITATTSPTQPAASSSSGTDWSAFTSNAGPGNSNAMPGAGECAVSPQVQGDHAVPLPNLPSNLGQSETDTLKTTTDTDWTAFTTTTVPSHNSTLAPNNDRYSAISESAVSEQLCVLTPSEPSGVSDAGASELQTITDIDWSAFNSTTTTNQNQNNTTSTDDRYSVFSQSAVSEQLCILTPSEPSLISVAGVSDVQSRKDTDSSVFSSTTPTTTTTDNKYSVFSQLQSEAQTPSSSAELLLSTQELLDYPLPNNTSLPPVPEAPSLISGNQQNTAAVVKGPVTTQLPAQSPTDRNTLEDFSSNEPPPLDDVSNEDETNEEDFNYLGFNSFVELPEVKSKRQETTNIEQNKLDLSSDSVNTEVFDTHPTEVTPLAAPSPSLFSLSDPTLPTDTLRLEATENDLSADPEEKTPLANTAQITGQGHGGSQLENEFSFLVPGDNKNEKELDDNLADLDAQLKGGNDFSFSLENLIPSQNLDYSEFSSFQKTSDFLKPESPSEENPEGNEENLQCDSDPFQDLSSLSSLQSNDLMKGRVSKPQEPNWTLFDTLATALQDINSVPIDNYKNQKFQPKKEPISGIQMEDSFARRSPLPPEARNQDFGEFIGSSNAGIAHKQLSRAPSYKLSEDSSKEVKEAWTQTLSSCARVIHLCYDKVKSATSVQILKELCSHDTSHQYFESVFEVMKIVTRIKKQLPPVWEQSNLAYEDITEDWANIKAYLNHGGLEFSDIIVSSGADSEGSAYHCGVCLDVITREEVRIGFGGFDYHSTCANFWLNEVGSMLPRLSRESHGASL